MKKNGNGKALVKAKSNLPVGWEKQMKDDAAKGRKRIEHIGVSQRVNTRGGILQFQGVPVPGNRLPCVILCDTFENAYYKDPFDPQNPKSPICYAFGEDDMELVPHEKAEKPQHEDCRTCEHNKWGSADKGRGKACKNGVRMFVMHADSIKKPATIPDASVALLNVPPTSLPGWAAHVKTVDELGNKPIYGVVTEVGVAPTTAGGFKLTFNVLRQITDKNIQGLIFAKRKSVSGDLEQPYPAIDAPARVKAKGKGKQKSATRGKQRF
jgi:hypothetical protein